MRIGIYNHQHLRGGCPVCSQTYVKGMIADGMKCMKRAKGIYGEDNEFVNYTDLGDYPSDNLERPGFKRMMTAVVADNLDVIVVITLDKITTDIDLLLETYKTIRQHNIELITANAVSYTHLDVYKRQTLRLVPGLVIVYGAGPSFPAATTTTSPVFHNCSTFFTSSSSSGFSIFFTGIPTEIFTIRIPYFS